MGALIFAAMGFRQTQGTIAWKPRQSVFTMSILLMIFLFISPTYRYLNFGTLPDFVIHAESMTSGLKGELFENSYHFQVFTSPEAAMAAEKTTLTKFASHFRPLLFIILPFYAIAPYPITLFLLQAMVIGLSVWPIFRLASVYLEGEKPAAVVAFSYMLYPTVLATAWSFFPDVWPITFLAWAFWFEHRGRHLAMLICLVLTLAAKEMMALPLISFGAYLFFLRHKTRWGTIIIGTGVLWLLLCLYWIIPGFSPEGRYHYFNVYALLGNTLFEMTWKILTQPWVLIPYLFSASAFSYLKGLFFPVAGFPLLGWKILLLCLPVLAQNLLAGIPGDMVNRWPEALWSAPLVPFIFLALLHGLAFLGKKFQPDWLKLTLGLLISSALSNTFVSIESHPQIWSNPKLEKAVHELKTQVPKGTVISTNVFLAWVQLSQSFKLYRFPMGLDKAEVLMIEYQEDSLSGKKNRQSQGLLPRRTAQPKPESPWKPFEKLYLEELNNSSAYIKISDIDYPPFSRLAILKKK
jgi:uncharacterized membrane protein